MHGLFEDEQDALSLGQNATTTALVSQDDISFFALYRCAAEKLEVEWPFPPPAQKSLRFGRFFLSPET